MKFVLPSLLLSSLAWVAGGSSGYSCSFPDGYDKFSVITKEDASLSTKTIYKGVAVGGHAYMNNNMVINSNCGSCKSYMYQYTKTCGK